MKTSIVTIISVVAVCFLNGCFSFYYPQPRAQHLTYSGGCIGLLYGADDIVGDPNACFIGNGGPSVGTTPVISAVSVSGVSAPAPNAD